MANVWYVRSDGGTTTQCTGLTNAAYPGSGTGQACAYADPQDAVDAADYADTIKLHAGHTFNRSGPIYFPDKGTPPTSTDADYITFTTDDTSGTPSALSGYPADQTRITTAMAANMPKIQTVNSNPVLNFPINSKYWSIERMNITNVDNGVQCIRLVSSDIDEDLMAYADLPHHLRFQYNWFHPVEETGTALGGGNVSRTAENTFYLSGHYITIRYNAMQGFVGRFKYGGEAGSPMTSSNLLISLGENWTVENNLLEAWTYSVFAIGAYPINPTTVNSCVGDPCTQCTFASVTGLSPGDPVSVYVSTSSSTNKWSAAFVDTIVGNVVTFVDPLCQSFDGGNSCTDQNGTPADGDTAQWLGHQPTDLYFHRNLFAHYPEWETELGQCGGKGYMEIKNAVNAVFDGNVFKGCSGMTVTARNQNGDAPWGTVSGLTFTNNYFENGNNVFVAFGQDVIPTNRSTGITWHNNLIVGVETWPATPSGRLSGNWSGIDDVTVTHNTVAFAGRNYNFSLFEASGPMSGVVMQNNIFPMGQNICFEPDGNTTQDVINCFSSPTVSHNVLVNEDDPDAGFYVPQWWTSWAPTNWVPTEWADVGFTNAPVALDKTGDYRLTAESPYHNAGSDSTDVGYDHTALVSALGFDPITGGAPPAAKVHARGKRKLLQ